MRSSNQEPDGPELSGEITAALSGLRAGYAHCPDAAMLQAAQAGVLPPEVSEVVKRHLEKCPVCRALVQDLSLLDDSPLQSEERLRIWNRIQAGVGSGKPLKSTASRSGWWTLLLRPWPVAVVTAAVILLVLAGGLWRERREPAATLSQVRPPKAVAPSSTVFRLEKAPIVLPASALMVWRGGADDGNPQWKELQEALAPYQADDYKEAAQRLKRVTERYPRLAEAQFYLGVCQLFLDGNEEAAESLKAARSQAQPPLREDVDWFLALADQRSGRADEARPLLEGLCREDAKNSAKACLGLKELPVIK
jgi:TolA-binding protein